MELEQEQVCESHSGSCAQGRQGRALLQSGHVMAAKARLFSLVPNSQDVALANSQQAQATGVTSKPFGIQVFSGTSILIPQGASVPGESSMIFTSSVEEQSSGLVPIVVGEETIASLTLSGMQTLGLHEHRIKVTFSLDDTCTLTVVATEIGNAAATVDAVHALTDACELDEVAPEQDCTQLPPSMQGATFPRGCAGAVWKTGLFNKKYCQPADAKYPWWKSCCKWEAKKCVPKDWVATTLPPAAEHIPSREKWGLVCAQKNGCSREVLEAFNGRVSWLYTYDQRLTSSHDPDNGILEWVNRNKVEFVPMFGWLVANLDPWNRCVFSQEQADVSDGKRTLCTYDQLSKLLAKTMEELVVRPRFLLAYNEFYQVHEGLEFKNVSPQQAVHYWRKFIQPLSLEFGLTLVSPVTGKAEKKAIWMANFLKDCWDNRFEDVEEGLPGCDVHLIKRMAVHEYSCKEKFYENNYGPDGQFQTLHISHLGSHGDGEIDWNKYINEMQLWMTETNCNMENIDNKDTTPPTPDESCKAITGQKEASHGIGSIRHFDNNPKFERWAWWNTYNDREDPRDDTIIAIWDSMSDGNGGVSPIGKAMLSDLSPIACDECVPTRYLPCE